MKVSFIGENATTEALKHQIELEGDVIVKTDSEMTIAGELPSKPTAQTIGGDYVFPSSVVSAMGFDLSTGPSQVYIYKWFDARTGFSDQLLIGIPISKFMVGNLGPSVPSGMASRFVDDSELGTYFTFPKLTEVLQKFPYTGFVTIGLNLDDATEVRADQT